MELPEGWAERASVVIYYQPLSTTLEFRLLQWLAGEEPAVRNQPCARLGVPAPSPSSREERGGLGAESSPMASDGIDHAYVMDPPHKL